MPYAASTTVKALSEALRNIPDEWTKRQRFSRMFLRNDPIERLVPIRLLCEGAAKLLDSIPAPRRAVILFFDRAGGREGALAAERLMPILAERWPGSFLICVSFATPSQGIGSLLRNKLAKVGADHGVTVDFVAHNRPAEGLKATAEDANRLTSDCDLVITFCPGGAAGLGQKDEAPVPDPMLAKSHLAVLSYMDPESLVAELPALKKKVEAEQELDCLRLWVQLETDEGAFKDVGYSTVGQGGDAEDRMWVMIDNARRQRYRVAIEPVRRGLPAGDPLLCPCRAVIEREVGREARVLRVVPAGSCIVVSARGESTFSQ